MGIKKVLLRTFYYISVCLVKIKSLAYFTTQFIFTTIYGSYDIFLVLFIGFTVLFQLTFTFIYSTFNKKVFNFSKISGSQIDPK